MYLDNCIEIVNSRRKTKKAKQVMNEFTCCNFNGLNERSRTKAKARYAEHAYQATQCVRSRSNDLDQSFARAKIKL